MINGFVALNKPPGITSQQAVSRVKKILGVKKAGHTGTLDPAATGLLLIALGRATRLTEYLLAGDKGYRAEIRFGVATDTGDSQGNVIEQQQCFIISAKSIATALANFRGEILQVPPAASALKINGRRAYELFRAGQAPEMTARPVTIHSLESLSPFQDITPCQPVLIIKVLCSKGTYIRSLATDIGQALDCPAHLSSLVRTSIAQVTLDQAATFQDLERDYRPWLLDPQIAVNHLPQVQFQPQQAKQFIYGQHVSAAGHQDIVAVFLAETLLGIGRGDGDKIQPVKVLVQEF